MSKLETRCAPNTIAYRAMRRSKAKDYMLNRCSGFTTRRGWCSPMHEEPSQAKAEEADVPCGSLKAGGSWLGMAMSMALQPRALRALRAADMICAAALANPVRLGSIASSKGNGDAHGDWLSWADGGERAGFGSK